MEEFKIALLETYGHAINQLITIISESYANEQSCAGLEESLSELISGLNEYTNSSCTTK